MASSKAPALTTEGAQGACAGQQSCPRLCLSLCLSLHPRLCLCPSFCLSLLSLCGRPSAFGPANSSSLGPPPQTLSFIKSAQVRQPLLSPLPAVRLPLPEGWGVLGQLWGSPCWFPFLRGRCPALPGVQENCHLLRGSVCVSSGLCRWGNLGVTPGCRAYHQGDTERVPSLAGRSDNYLVDLRR